eukprot:1421520-Amphidinium_carterae.1
MKPLSRTGGYLHQCFGHRCFGASGTPARWEQRQAIDDTKSRPQEREVPLSSVIRANFRTTGTSTTPATYHTVSGRIRLGSRQSPRD